jgi:hypothetical protein
LSNSWYHNLLWFPIEGYWCKSKYEYHC